MAFLSALRAPTRFASAEPPIARRVKWESSKAQAQPRTESVRAAGRPLAAMEAFLPRGFAPAAEDSRVFPSARRRVRTWKKKGVEKVLVVGHRTSCSHVREDKAAEMVQSVHPLAGGTPCGSRRRYATVFWSTMTMEASLAHRSTRKPASSLSAST